MAPNQAFRSGKHEFTWTDEPPMELPTPGCVAVTYVRSESDR